jgi:predicted glutamine amidotransferase
MYLGERITLSSLVTEPSNSIIRQSFKSREQEEPLNGDGFGVAWYAPQRSARPALFRDVTPAWNNANLLDLARVTESSCILAHVRAATPGYPVTNLNCHPFSWGPFSFMHNGRVEGFQAYRRALLSGLSDEAFGLISGSTDSEHLFALFVDCLEDGGSRPETLDGLQTALLETIGRIEQLRKAAGVELPSRLNMAVTDGVSAVVSRFISTNDERADSLYFCSGSHYVCQDGVCRMEELDNGRGAVIVASEPLSEDRIWTRVEPNTMVGVHQDLRVETASIKLA